MTKQCSAETCPKASIVIPVYNGSNYLREAIDSALAQTYKNVEIIVVNDGSNDKGATEKIAKSYGDRIRYYPKENGGVASALNFGIQKMTGEYFSWLSHDDLYEKTKIEDQIGYLKKIAIEDVIIATNAKTLFVNGIRKKEPIDAKTFKYIDIFLATSAVVGINGCSLLIPKKALKNNGGFDENLPVTQDYDLWFRLKDKYKFVLLEKYLVVSRRHDDQDSVRKQKILYEAGDELHSTFLKSIPYERFVEYFNESKKNIEHTLDNYKTYRNRGYRKTSFELLKIILRYCFESDIKKFYRIYNSEVGKLVGSKLVGDKEGGHLRSTRDDHSVINTDLHKILLECDKLPAHLSEGFSKNAGSHTREIIKSPLKRLIISVKRDGFYLTAEKMVRKFLKKISN